VQAGEFLAIEACKSPRNLRGAIARPLPSVLAAKIINWKTVAVAYCAGNKSLRALGIEHGVSHVAVKKKADKEGWVKDLPERIKVVTGAQVNKTAYVLTMSRK
jgi:hypothetical protein